MTEAKGPDDNFHFSTTYSPNPTAGESMSFSIIPTGSTIANWHTNQWRQYLPLTTPGLTHWPLGVWLKFQKNNFQANLSWLMAEVYIATLHWGGCHWTALMVWQHCFRQRLGAVRQQTDTWANVDQDIGHIILSLDHSELMTLLHPIPVRCRNYGLWYYLTIQQEAWLPIRNHWTTVQ